MNKPNPIPEEFHTLTPFINATDAAALIEFLQKAFGAELCNRLDMPDGKVMHAVVRIGDSSIMIGEACGEMGPTPASLYFYVKDVDAVFKRAVEQGAESKVAPDDMFWGDRMCTVQDAWGNNWHIATHTEDVPQDEVEDRAKAFIEQMGNT